MESFSFRTRDDGEVTSKRKGFVGTKPNHLAWRKRIGPSLDTDFQGRLGNHPRFVFQQPLVDGPKAFDVELTERNSLAADAAPRCRRRKIKQHAGQGTIRQLSAVQDLPLGRVDLEEISAAGRDVLPRCNSRKSLIEYPEQRFEPSPQARTVFGPIIGRIAQQILDQTVDRICLAIEPVLLESGVPRLGIEDEENAIQSRKRRIAVKADVRVDERGRVVYEFAMHSVLKETRDQTFSGSENGSFEVFRYLLGVLAALDFYFVDRASTVLVRDEL